MAEELVEAAAETAGPTFSIIGATVSGNRGAEAMLSTTIAQLRERFPDARFNIFTYYPDDDRRLVTDPALRVYSSTPTSLATKMFFGSLLGGFLRRLGVRQLPRLVPVSVRALADSAALVDLAGVSFIDGREKFLPFNVLTIWPAMMLRVPVVKLAQACGPFRRPLNRWAARRWLARCEKVFARGDTTTENLRELPLPDDRLAEASDVAFLHETGVSLGCENLVASSEVRDALEAERKAGRAVLGICPSSVIASKAKREGWDYPAFLAEIARGALSRGQAVLLFPNATRERQMEKLRNNDLPVIAQVTALLEPEQRVHSVTFDLNTDGIKELIACCDTTMVSRFHAMVGSLTVKTPVLVLGWSHKYLEVMEQFAMGGYVFDYTEHDANAVLEKLDELSAERTHLKRSIAQRLRRVRASSAKQFDYVAELVRQES